MEGTVFVAGIDRDRGLKRLIFGIVTDAVSEFIDKTPLAYIRNFH